MKTTPRDLPIPDDCRVRLVDLPVQAGGMIAVDAEGFVNIYINARLSRDAQMKALQHELQHHYRGDLYSDEDIRVVEREAGTPGLISVDGAPLKGVPAPFDPEEFRQVGKGLYLPTGENLARAGQFIEGIKPPLMEACKIYDVAQTPPLLPLTALVELAGALGAGDVAFVAWQYVGARCRPALHFSREDLYGAIYFSDDGAPDDALAVMTVDDVRVTVDLRRRNGRMDVWGIVREVEGRRERVY